MHWQRKNARKLTSIQSDDREAEIPCEDKHEEYMDISVFLSDGPFAPPAPLHTNTTYFQCKEGSDEEDAISFDFMSADEQAIAGWDSCAPEPWSPEGSGDDNQITEDFANLALLLWDDQEDSEETAAQITSRLSSMSLCKPAQAK
jgi:hypothetical protein